MRFPPLLLALVTLGVGVHETPHGTIIASNMRDNTATVIDAASGKVLATVTTSEAPHEVATTHDGKWAVVSNYGTRERPGNSITVIDLNRLVVARTIDLGEYRRPHGMAFFPGDTLLAVTSEVSRAVLLLDFRSGKVIGTVPTSGRTSHMLAMSSAGDELFTTNIADGSISRLDVAKRSTRIVIPVAKQVEGIAISPDGKHVWVGSNADGIVVVIDTDKGQPIDTLIGFGIPYRLAVSRDGATAIVTDPSRGEVRIFDARTRRQRSLITVPRGGVLPTAEVPGSPSPEGVTTSPDGRWAFVTLQGRNLVAMIDLQQGTIVAYAPTGTWSDGIAYSTLEVR
ncbi:MAG TPA: cytochrome D1 domain-containing protein [Gemmatimonadaceae bacterium]|jgi:YVTN family beta-propeller protein